MKIKWVWVGGTKLRLHIINHYDSMSMFIVLDSLLVDCRVRVDNNDDDGDDEDCGIDGRRC